MQRNVIIVVLLCVIFQCNGHLPSLTDILSGAHKRVHQAAHGVAHTVLGGFNFDGHVQIGGHHSHPQPAPPNEGETETIIVIVDESPDDTYAPGPQNRPNQGHGQYNDFINKPHNPYGHNDHGQGRPYPNQNSNYNNVNSNGPPGQNNNHCGQNPNNYGNQNDNQNQQANQNDYIRPEQTTQNYGNSNNNRPSDQSPGNTNQNNYAQTQSPPVETRPTFASTRVEDKPTEKPYQNNKITTESDVPEFVALYPNEYVYGGNKINITAPKRETASDNDEDSPIDVRFQDN